jgi:hypothetical protein
MTALAKIAEAMLYEDYQEVESSSIVTLSHFRWVAFKPVIRTCFGMGYTYKNGRWMSKIKVHKLSMSGRVA